MLFDTPIPSHQIFYEVVPLKPIIELDILNELTASVEDQIEVVRHSFFIA